MKSTKLNLAVLAIVSLFSQSLVAQTVSAGVACIHECRDLAQASDQVKQGFLVLALSSPSAEPGGWHKSAAEQGLLGRDLFLANGTLDQIPVSDNFVGLLVSEQTDECSLTATQKSEVLCVLTPVRDSRSRAGFAQGDNPDKTRTAAPGVGMIPLGDNRILAGGVPLLNPPNYRDHHNARFVGYTLAEKEGVSAAPFPTVLVPNAFPAPALDGKHILLVGGIGRKTARNFYPTLGLSLWKMDDWMQPSSRLSKSGKSAEESESVIMQNTEKKRNEEPDAIDRAGAVAEELDRKGAV